MKKIWLIYVVLFILVSCSTSKITTSKISFIPKSQILFGLDFRPYTEQGFLVTPYSYSEPYESIGVLTLSILPEAKKVVGNTYRTSDSPNSTIQVEYIWLKSDISPEETIEAMYQECKKLGADALVDFNIKPISKHYNTDPPVSIDGFEVTGFAIKRK